MKACFCPIFMLFLFRMRWITKSINAFAYCLALLSNFKCLCGTRVIMFAHSLLYQKLCLDGTLTAAKPHNSAFILAGFSVQELEQLPCAGLPPWNWLRLGQTASLQPWTNIFMQRWTTWEQTEAQAFRGQSRKRGTFLSLLCRIPQLWSQVTMSGQSEETNREAAEESMNLCPFTTLSTIAVQAGQSQIVISVLKVWKKWQAYQIY